MDYKIKISSLTFLFLISLLLVANSYQIWYVGILILFLFFINYNKRDFSHLILFTLFVSLFGIYLSMPFYPEVQLYRLLVLPLAISVLFKEVRVNNKEYFIFLGLMIYVFIQQILIDRTFSINNYIYIFKILFIISISLLTYYLITKNKTNLIMSTLKCFLIFNAGIAIFEMVTGSHLYFSNINNYTSTVIHSPTGFFFNQNDLGVASLLILQMIFLLENNIKKNLGIFIVSTFLIFATASRTVMLLYLAFLIFYLLINNNLLKNSKKIVILSFTILMIGIAIIFLFWNKDNIQTQNYTLNKILNINNMFDSREDLYEYHLNLLIEHPFGLSTTQYNELVFEKKVNNTHSFLIEVGQRFGIIMLLGIVIFIFRIIFKLLKEKRFLDVIVFGITILLTNVNSTILTGFNVFWIIIVLQLVYFLGKGQEEKDEGIDNRAVLS